ncbi:MAG: energy-coupling factor ABC transporter ATP-binding protein [Spirochaetia bacterium]
MNDSFLCAEAITVRTRSRTLLSEVSMRLPAASLSVLAGGVGAGKSLLARVLAGLLEPDSGTVRFRGAPMKEARIRKPDGIGIVFQDSGAHLLGATVGEDVLIGPASAGVPPRTQYTMRDRALRLCGISALREQPVHMLSGGEIRLTALAATIATHPSVLICDEPFANLDWPSVDRVLNVLLNVAESGSSVLVVTHELEKVLAHADRLFVLDHGSLTHSISLPGEMTESVRESLLTTGLRMTEPLSSMSWIRNRVRADL